MIQDTQDLKIYMIHGFASGAKHPNAKAGLFEEVFGLPVQQIEYDSAASFAENMVTLHCQVDGVPHIMIGTSLGAFYASQLSEHYAEQVQLLLMLNPCHTPAEILKHAVGAHENFVTGESFEFTHAALQSYAGIPFMDSNIALNRHVLVNLDDDLIDGQRTMDLFGDVVEITSFASGGHRFENLGSDEVKEVLRHLKV
ncbi:MAG: YqiA/YcfP family alpha/beta fold hydrolase [Ghiorsea sp.]|nr:YqiA/YcfP family alpha/beta fold hydrolase [Ghiorsea sp.]